MHPVRVQLHLDSDQGPRRPQPTVSTTLLRNHLRGRRFLIPAHHRYVQELENRVIRLEAVLAQVAPHVNLTNLPTGPIPLPEGQAQAQAPPAVVNGGASSVTSRPSRSGAIPGLPPIRRSRSVERNDDDFVAEHMGALALDDHGHLRFVQIQFLSVSWLGLSY